MLTESPIYIPEVTEKDTDFIGFTYNDVHSDTLGIKRVSDGSRYGDIILPIFQDKTVQVPGGDGMYLYGSYYTNRTIPINFAFDNMTDEDYERFKRLIGDKKIHKLSFDESPYKYYNAKVSGTATYKFIPFDENDQTIYKGEGNISFIAYFPYAICDHDKKWLDYWGEIIPKWNDAAKLISKGTHDVLNGTQIQVYNPGVIESPFLLSLNFKDGSIPQGGISVDGKSVYQLNWSTISPKGNDDSVVINSKMNLIEGYNGEIKTGNIYNQYITSGNFFHIPFEENSLTLTNVSENYSDIKYNYYYF